MDFLTYLKFKYKLNKQVVRKKSSAVVYAERSTIFIIAFIFAIIIYYVLKLFHLRKVEQINGLAVIYYILLLITTLSMGVKKYYKEYFESLEREIVLIVSMNKLNIGLARFFSIWVECLRVISFMFMPFIVACFWTKIININMIIISVVQLVFMAFLGSVFAHLLFAVAFIISNGRGLKSVAYTIVIVFSLTFSSITAVVTKYSKIISINNVYIKELFYGVIKYPEYLIYNNLKFKDVIIFIIVLTFYFIILSFITVKVTLYCYKKGLLSISSRELNRSFYMKVQTKFVTRFIKNYFLKKDIIYIFRNPKLLASYIYPILAMLLPITRGGFFTTPMMIPIFTGIVSIIISVITLNIILSDDIEHKNLILSLPVDTEKLLVGRRLLTFFISFFISITLILIIYLVEFVKTEYIIFSIIEILVMIYFASIFMCKRLIEKSVKKAGCYTYDGNLQSIVAVYIFKQWILKMLVFCIAFNYLFI